MSIALEFPDPLQDFSRLAAIRRLPTRAVSWLGRSSAAPAHNRLICWGRGTFTMDGTFFRHATPGVQQQYQEVIGFPLHAWSFV